MHATRAPAESGVSNVDLCLSKQVDYTEPNAGHG